MKRKYRFFYFHWENGYESVGIFDIATGVGRRIWNNLADAGSSWTEYEIDCRLSYPPIEDFGWWIDRQEAARVFGGAKYLRAAIDLAATKIPLSSLSRPTPETVSAT